MFDIFKPLTEKESQTVVVVKQAKRQTQSTHRRIRPLDGRIAAKG